MKIVLVNTYDLQGGAAMACFRLHQALSQIGEHSTYLVKKKTSDQQGVMATIESKWQEWKAFYHFVYERLSFLPYERDKQVRFQFSLANSGTDISLIKAVKEADIIHLHWFNQGFLSMKSLEKLKALKKPIVWTLHDMWAFTGGCHYSGDCDHYQQECNNCHLLKNPKDQDLSGRLWKGKEALYHGMNLNVVTCSQWLGRMASSSQLLGERKIRSIPNPIDVDFYKPLEQSEIRTRLKLPSDKFLLMFVAMNIDDERKGFKYMAEALTQLDKTHPELRDKLELLIVGKADEAAIAKLPYQAHYLGLITEASKMVEAYNAGDAFIIPSLQDNLPNTVMEALACGKPVIAFETGGIPEMVEHMQNGFIAKYKDTDRLAEGIQWILENKDSNKLQKSARQKVLDNYTYDVIAHQYLELYRSLV